MDIILSVNNKFYQKINNILHLPINTDWTIVKTDTGHKAVTNCSKCILNSSKQHTQQQLSCLFINDDMSVVKSCYSCGSVVMDKITSKKINAVFNIILNKKNTIFQELVHKFLLECKLCNYKREKHTGVIYRQVDSHGYVKYMEPMDFLNSIFKNDPIFSSDVNNMNNLIKYMKQYNHVDCPFL
jgi:hypothetical protein